MLSDHGGNIKKVSDFYKIPQAKIIDFSSNINPLGISKKVKDIITKNISRISQYPDPECKSARRTLSNYLGVNRENILLGNGSCELIYLIPKALKCASCLIYNPTFSEYAWAIKHSGARCFFLFAREKDGFSIHIDKIMQYVNRVNLIILCNPNNPTSFLLEKKQLLKLINACKNSKTYLLVDEVFMEFVPEENKFSLVREVKRNSHLLVLKSLTKFFSLAGLRIGYLVADKSLLKKINLLQPTWSVNILAQEIISDGIFDLDFIKRSREYISREKDFLFTQLKKIKAISPYPPCANFIFCKIQAKRINAHLLSKRLIESGILIRDCSNFKGLDSRFFRIAVRKRKDNLYLLESLRKIFQ